MRINRLTLKNIRLFGDNLPPIRFSKNVTIFLGDNGCGKSTLLDSISYLISPFIAQFPSMSDTMISEWDVHRNENGRLSNYLEIQGDFTTTDGTAISETRIRKGLGQKVPESELKAIKQLAQNLKADIIEGKEDVRLPIFAYYGTGRGHINAPERKRNFQKVFERWDCYHNALLPSTDFKSFFAWFDLMEDEERRKSLELRDFNYKLPALEAVRNALKNFVGEKFHSPRIQLHPLRFVMTEKTADGTERDIRIEQLSDGYKIVIAMVADIASRMAEANPDMPNPLLSSGIILVDEIDLHLHPKWQREIVGQLTHTFPNIQFILTTHSPIIIAGAADIAQVISLSGAKEGRLEDLSTQRDIKLMNISQILLSDMFGLQSLRSPIWDDKLQRRDHLLSLAEPSDAEKEEIEQLNRELSSLEEGDSPTEIATNKLLEEIAKNLGVKI